MLFHPRYSCVRLVKPESGDRSEMLLLSRSSVFSLVKCASGEGSEMLLVPKAQIPQVGGRLQPGQVADARVARDQEVQSRHVNPSDQLPARLT